ncbi:MAG: MFS transporter [Candidatus Kapabacteria bacterium]|nr:MFS transporter [Candidatus Kapabacteria bacterium]
MIAIVDLVRNKSNLDPWQRNLLVLWIAQFIAMIGMSACIPFLPLFVLELGVAKEDAALWSGIFTAAPFVMSALLTPLWGVLGDKYGQKSMVVRGVLGLGIAMTLMGLSTNIWMLLGLRIFQGAASGFVASNNAFVSAQTPSEKVGVSLGTLVTSISAGNIIGPLIGGVISDALGFRPVFFFVGVMCAASLVILIVKLREERTTVSTRGARVMGNVRVAMRSPQLRSVLIMIILSQTAIVLATPIFPFYLEELGAPTSMLSTLAGLVVSIVGVCTIISAPWWGARSDRYGFRKTVIVAGSVVAIGMLMQAAVPSYEWLFPVRTMMGLAVGALLPLMYSELSRNAPAGRKGGVMGLASSATLLGNLAGPLICSAIAMQFPLRWVFVASTCVMMLAVGIVLMKNRERQ